MGASSESYEYLSLFFSPSFGIGMDRIAESIVDCLSYFDVVNLKRSCRLMRAYVDDRMADKRSKWRKLKKDWREAEASVVELNGIARVRHAKFYDDCRKILLSSGDDVLSFDVRSSADTAEIVFPGVADNTISTFDLDEEKQRLSRFTSFTFCNKGCVTVRVCFRWPKMDMRGLPELTHPFRSNNWDLQITILMEPEGGFSGF